MDALFSLAHNEVVISDSATRMLFLGLVTPYCLLLTAYFFHFPL